MDGTHRDTKWGALMNKRPKEDNIKEDVVVNHKVGNGSVGTPLSKILQNGNDNSLAEHQSAKTKGKKSNLRSMEQSPDRLSESSDSDSSKKRVFQTPIRDR